MNGRLAAVRLRRHRHEASNDKQGGPVEGLLWLGGSVWSNDINNRVIGNISITSEQETSNKQEESLVARDAFSGLPLWRRGDIRQTNRYAFLVDAERVYVHDDTWPFMRDWR